MAATYLSFPFLFGFGLPLLATSSPFLPFLATSSPFLPFFATSAPFLPFFAISSPSPVVFFFFACVAPSSTDDVDVQLASLSSNNVISRQLVNVLDTLHL